MTSLKVKTEKVESVCQTLYQQSYTTRESRLTGFGPDKSSVDQDRILSTPAFPSFSWIPHSSVMFSYAPYLWSPSMSHFYPLWSLYWSYLNRKPCESTQPVLTIPRPKFDICESQSSRDGSYYKEGWNSRDDFKILSSKKYINKSSKCFKASCYANGRHSLTSNPPPANLQPTIAVLTCPHCGFQSKSPIEFQLHYWISHGKHVCSICGRTFAQKANRDRHMCLHTGARPYPCDMCGEKFSRGDKLKIHKSRCHDSTR